ncbi:uncharacterized protein LOC132804552 [Ziziphus jujuba]|uniref:Uncharacterized protein LOC132804552 n=1 Tax=Ziziphus jujuba TaxID=326968 RepID=A0ABM4AEM8_ZIZJJ|nr:uncharacterized protein LOC132804552 [Ziziphus jujuba]
MATFSFLYYILLLLISLLLVSIAEAGTKVVDYELLKSKNIDGVKLIENSIAAKPDADQRPRVGVWQRPMKGKRCFRKCWTMLVEQGLTVPHFLNLVSVMSPIPCWPTLRMLSTAIIKGKVKQVALVILMVLLIWSPNDLSSETASSPSE